MLDVGFQCDEKHPQKVFGFLMKACVIKTKSDVEVAHNNGGSDSSSAVNVSPRAQHHSIISFNLQSDSLVGIRYTNPRTKQTRSGSCSLLSSKFLSGIIRNRNPSKCRLLCWFFPPLLSLICYALLILQVINSL